MANHYLQFSFKVPLTGKQAMETEQAVILVQNENVDWRLGATAEDIGDLDFRQAFPHLATEPKPGVKQTLMALYAGLAAAIDDPEDIEEGQGCPALSGLSFESGPEALYIGSHEYGNVEGAAALIAALQERYGIEPMGFSYAQHCSKLKIDEFHGGTIWVDHGKVDWMHTSQWLAEKRNELRTRKEARAAAAQDEAPAP